jgi:glycosyltransferase involved in cell wall biosynthesis
MRSRAGAGPADVLVVAPGDQNAAKQLDAVAAAVARLPGRVRLVLAGRTIPGYDAAAAITAADIGDRALVAADVSDDDFRAWIAAADIVVDLRYPHRGETSGSLARSLQSGRACVVSATGAYLDLGDAVATVPAGPVDAAELAAVLGGLADDAERRAALGTRARSLAADRYSSEATARGYERAIERTLALALDPVRLALPRWARALNDLGVAQEHVNEGVGVSYVRGLQELAAAIPEGDRPASFD